MSRPYPGTPRRILIVALRQLGDCLLATPLVRALRRSFPHAHIAFLVERPFAPLTEGHPDLDRVIAYDPRRGRSWRGLGGYLEASLDALRVIRRNHYDCIIDLLGNQKTALMALISGARWRVGFAGRPRQWAYTHVVSGSGRERYVADRKCDLGRVLGAEPEDLNLSLSIPDAAGTWAEGYLRSAGFADGRPLVAMAPTSIMETRRWMPEGYAAVADRVAREIGAHILLLWGPGERDRALAVASQMGTEPTLVPPTDLGQLAALLARCDVLVSNDNGPKHVAVAAGTPTVTIFGPTDERTMNPPDAVRHPALRVDVPCARCGLKRGCPNELICMTRLDPDTTFQRVAAIVADRRAEGTSRASATRV